MAANANILCIGSVLWDIIGRAPTPMHLGADVPGRITRLPGGVAMNIAMTLRRFGLTPSLLTAIGRDDEGHELISTCQALGMDTTYVHRPLKLPTDIYMAIEGAGHLTAAIADAHSLEAVGDAILTPLEDGTLGSVNAPYTGMIALDGNLTESLLADIASRDSFRAADIRLAPASPGKAKRLAPLMGHAGVTLYVNREEAGILTGSTPDNAVDAATGLLAIGAHRVLVTDGPNGAAEGMAGNVTHAPAPAVTVKRITGAGDTFMAGHIAAELAGANRQDALPAALQAAADYISKEDHDL